MSDRSGSDKVMSIQDEAKTVIRNVENDSKKIAHYIMHRCGDFTFDSEREAFIAAFLEAVQFRELQTL